MVEPTTRADLEMQLEFDTIYLANGLEALGHLIETSRDLPRADQLGHLVKHSARYAEEVKHLTIKLVTMKP